MTHSGCVCSGGLCESKPVRHRQQPVGALLLCERGGQPGLGPVVRRLVDVALDHVEREYEDQDLLKELGASWESLDTLFEITSDLQTFRNPQEVLASIVGRIAARRPSLHAVLWIEFARRSLLSRLTVRNSIDR
ncbi:MAG TPA: hypothetical protein VGK32_05615 [Vicinamibacterales bacterium]